MYYTMSELDLITEAGLLVGKLREATRTAYYAGDYAAYNRALALQTKAAQRFERRCAGPHRREWTSEYAA